MRWLIWYIRSCFCKHVFKYDEVSKATRTYGAGAFQNGPMISATCSKCGYHRSYWKYDPK
jgi:hypothetical protein